MKNDETDPIFKVYPGLFGPSRYELQTAYSILSAYLGKFISGELLEIIVQYSQVLLIIPRLKTNHLMNEGKTRWDFRDQSITNHECRIISELLKSYTALKELGLRGNNIGNTGTCAIGKMLKTNTTIIKLELRYNQIGDEGVKVIADALKCNELIKLITLFLDKNKIGNDGAKAIGEALHENRTLELLYISWNKIGDCGAKAIVDKLEHNKIIRGIYLGCNVLTSQTKNSLMASIKNYNSKCRLSL